MTGYERGGSGGGGAFAYVQVLVIITSCLRDPPVQATLDKLRGPRGLCDQLTGQEGSLWTYVTLLIIKFVDL